MIKNVVKVFILMSIMMLSACNSGGNTLEDNNNPAPAKDELGGSIYNLGGDMPIYQYSPSSSTSSTTMLDIRGFNSVTGHFSARYCYKATPTANAYQSSEMGDNTISFSDMDSDNTLDTKWEQTLKAEGEKKGENKLGASVDEAISSKYFKQIHNVLKTVEFFMYGSATYTRSVNLTYSAESAPGPNGSGTTFSGLSADGNNEFNIITNNGTNITESTVKEFYRVCGDTLPKSINEAAWVTDVTKLDSINQNNLFKSKRVFNSKVASTFQGFFINSSKATGEFESQLQKELTTNFGQSTFFIDGHQKGGSPSSVTPYNSDCILSVDQGGLANCQGLANQWSSAVTNFYSSFTSTNNPFFENGAKLFDTLSMQGLTSAVTLVPVGGNIKSTYTVASDVLAARKTIYKVLKVLNNDLEEIYALMDSIDYIPSIVDQNNLNDNIIENITSLRQKLSFSSMSQDCYIANTVALSRNDSKASKACTSRAQSVQSDFSKLQPQLSVLNLMIRTLSLDLDVEEINSSQQLQGKLFDFNTRYSSLNSSGYLKEFEIFNKSYGAFSSKTTNAAQSSLSCVPTGDSTFKNLSYINVVHQYSCPNSGNCDISIVGDCTYQTQNGLQEGVNGKFNLSFNIGDGGGQSTQNSNEIFTFYGSYTTVVNGNFQYTPVAVVIKKTPLPESTKDKITFPLSSNPLNNFGSAAQTCPMMLYHTYSQILFGVCQNTNNSYNASTLYIPSFDPSGPSNSNGMLY